MDERRHISTCCRELHSLDEFHDWITQVPGPRDVVLQSIDLRSETDKILQCSWEQVVLLGCELELTAERHVSAHGGTIFPLFDGIPYDPYRADLYTCAELTDDALDTRIYEHQVRFPRTKAVPILEALAQRLHDHAIDNALGEYLRTRPNVVAIMGGHALKRSEPLFRTVAETAKALTSQGYHVVTGGGPGAMEAANLGAWMAHRERAELDEAIETLATQDDYTTSEYVALAKRVREQFPDGAESLAIPTWFYGHEPTNEFATAVAKYFSNSIREDGLLAIATHGVIYTPGAAGTVQEVFMDATQNHYGTFDFISPMVFLDSGFWGLESLAAPALLEQLAGDRPYGEMIGVFDDVEDVVRFIKDHPPLPARS